MAFSVKTWVDRVVEYAGRRTLTDVDSGEEMTVDIVRDEGEVSEVGDAFSADNMNDMEERISDAFAEITSVTVTVSSSGWSSSAPYTNSVSVSGMTEDWIPGNPVLVTSGDNDADLAALEAFACVSTIASASEKLTFTCYEDLPEVSFTIRIPGIMEA